MDLDEFSRQIEVMQARILRLQPAAMVNQVELHSMWEETAAALATTMEEMRVAEEELRQQNHELERSRQEIESERQRYQDLFDFAPDGYLLTDRSGIIREANRAASELLGVPPAYLVNKPLANFVSMEDRPGFRGGLSRLVGVGRKQDWIVRLQPRLRPTFDATITAAVVRDWDGEPSSLRWMFREAPRIGLPGPRTAVVGAALSTAGAPEDGNSDRPTRLRGDGEAKALRRLMEGIEIINWEADARTGQYWFISSCAEKVFGYPPERWLSEPGFWAATIHQDDRSLAESQRQSFIRECRPAEVEYRVVAADGRIVRVRESLDIDPEEGGSRRALRGCLREITRSKEESASEWDRRNEDFLATLAHELRNPLSAIQTCAHLLRPDAVDESMLAETRNVIDRQVRYMSRLVEDLLDATRLSRGTIPLRSQPVDPAMLVARAVKDVGQLIEARGHELTVSLPDEPVTLVADPIRLQQILTNLLTNAAKYTDPGGLIDLIVTREADELVLKVRDTGIGMAPEALLSVFDLFNQVEGTGERASGGLGIGLSLVKSLAELHGGTVSAYSAGPGLGSEFVVRLPIGAAPSTDLVAGATASDPVARRAISVPSVRILIVEDEPDLARALAQWLRTRGHAVEVAHDGPTALDAAHTDPPFLVFLDLGLPGIDGFEVARRLRVQNGRLPRIVALTGDHRAADRSRAREAGIDDLLVKPIDLDDLDRWLESALG